MGTAGLDVELLTRLLRRIKVDCSVIEADESQDHCILRLSTCQSPGWSAFVEYVNQGLEPRLAGIKMEPPAPNEEEQVGESFWITEAWINLSGARAEDPQR